MKDGSNAIEAKAQRGATAYGWLELETRGPRVRSPFG